MKNYLASVAAINILENALVEAAKAADFKLTPALVIIMNARDHCYAVAQQALKEIV